MPRKKAKLSEEQIRFVQEELDIDASDLSAMDKGTFDVMINELLFIECDEAEDSDDYENSARYQMVSDILAHFERQPA